MSTTTNYFYAVMHCSPLQPKKLLTLLNKVITNLTTNAVKFPSPTNAVATLQAEVTPFTTAIGNATGGSLEDTAARNKEAIKVHGLLQGNLPYINGIAKGDKDTILLSGYDASNQAQPAAVPDAPVIKKVENGVEHGTCKMLLAKHTGYKGKRTFFVEVSTSATDPNSFKLVLITGSSRKLVIPGLTRGQEIFIRLYSMNAKGKSHYSNVVSFIPNTGASPGTTPTPGTGTTPPPATA